DAGAVRPFVAFVTLLEKRFPLSAAVRRRQRLRVVLDLQQRIAAFALVHDGVERIFFSALRVDTLKPGSVWHHNSTCAATDPGLKPWRDSSRLYHGGDSGLYQENTNCVASEALILCESRGYYRQQGRRI